MSLASLALASKRRLSPRKGNSRTYWTPNHYLPTLIMRGHIMSKKPCGKGLPLPWCQISSQDVKRSQSYVTRFDGHGLPSWVPFMLLHFSIYHYLWLALEAHLTQTYERRSGKTPPYIWRAFKTLNGRWRSYSACQISPSMQSLPQEEHH